MHKKWQVCFDILMPERQLSVRPIQNSFYNYKCLILFSVVSVSKINVTQMVPSSFSSIQLKAQEISFEKCQGGLNGGQETVNPDVEHCSM